jgi:prevent-host-death family protein
MASLGIREFRDELSRYIRRAEQGERINVTDHGRVVAVLVSPGAASADPIQALIQQGHARGPLKSGPLPAGWQDIGVKLPKGTAEELIAADRMDTAGIRNVVKRAAKPRGRR